MATAVMVNGLLRCLKSRVRHCDERCGTSNRVEPMLPAHGFSRRCRCSRLSTTCHPMPISPVIGGATPHTTRKKRLLRDPGDITGYRGVASRTGRPVMSATATLMIERRVAYSRPAEGSESRASARFRGDARWRVTSAWRRTG